MYELVWSTRAKRTGYPWIGSGCPKKAMASLNLVQLILD